MTRARWAVVLAVDAVVAVLAALFLGTQVPPCFGSVPTGKVSEVCVAAWQAQRPWWDKLFDTPLGALALFIVLAAVTVIVLRLVARRR